jgi:ethanolamine ammonia-lyase small subunit
MTSMKIWDSLKSLTQARIGLSRSGHAVSTKENLNFQLAHAQARDAIHRVWDIEKLREELKKDGVDSQVFKTQVSSRHEYLARPDLGRVLDAESVKKILPKKNLDILMLVSNGLSSDALHKHGVSFLKFLIFELKKKSFSVEVCLVPDARVALGDQLGELFKAKLCLTLIGERPGLTSPDSMGLYLTFEPRKGRTDAERNCISNIREPHGLSFQEAVRKTLHLTEESLRLKLSGFQLKDESSNNSLEQTPPKLPQQ